MDTVFLMTIAAAGLIGWVWCRTNPHVARPWLWLSIPAICCIGLYLVVALAGARMEWWSGATMDRPILALSLMPVLAWPIRRHGPKQIALAAG